MRNLSSVTMTYIQPHLVPDFFSADGAEENLVLAGMDLEKMECHPAAWQDGVTNAAHGLVWIVSMFWKRKVTSKSWAFPRKGKLKGIGTPICFSATKQIFFSLSIDQN